MLVAASGPAVQRRNCRVAKSLVSEAVNVTPAMVIVSPTRRPVAGMSGFPPPSTPMSWAVSEKGCSVFAYHSRSDHVARSRANGGGSFGRPP